MLNPHLNAMQNLHNQPKFSIRNRHMTLPLQKIMNKIPNNIKLPSSNKFKP